MLFEVLICVFFLSKTQRRGGGLNELCFCFLHVLVKVMWRKTMQNELDINNLWFEFWFQQFEASPFYPTHKKNSLNPCDRFMEYIKASLKKLGFSTSQNTHVKVGRKWKRIGDYFPSRFDSDTDGVVPAGVESTLKDTTHCHCIEATTLKVNLFAVIDSGDICMSFANFFVIVEMVERQRYEENAHFVRKTGNRS